ncbi:MAG TPA: hypothetical protein VK186_09800, partial [Candidatus Deferrimicrobium sp.]|nr:hypothetical protein [Candidatus Deferrimicrobium sp.]
MKKESEEKQKYGVNKKIIKFILIPVIVLAVFFLLFFPPLVKAYLIDTLNKLGLKNPQFTIRHVGLNELDIQHFSVGEPGKPGLTIPNLVIDFSWPRLLKNRIQKIEVTGMTLHVLAGKEGIVISGLEPLFERKAGGKPIMPFDRVEIGSSVAQVVWEGQSLTIPFSLSAVYGVTKKNVDFVIDLTPYGEPIIVKGAINMDTGTGAINIAADRADLEKYFNDLNITFFQWLKSRLQLQAEINVADWAIRDSHISLAAPAFAASISGGNIIKGSVNLDFKLNRLMQPEDVQLKLRIENIDDKVIQVEIPFNIDITGSRLTNLQLKLDYLKLKQPPGIHFRDFNGTASLDSGRLQAQGAFACGIDAEFFPWLSPGWKMEGGLSFKGNVQVLADDTGTTWNLSGLGGGKVSFISEDMRAGMGNLALSLAAVGKGDRIENRLDVDLKDVAIKYEDLVFSAAHVFSQNNINLTGGKNWTGWGKVK